METRLQISEIAQHLNVDKVVIRFWKKEFGIPTNKLENGEPFYTEKNFEFFKTVKNLLHDQGLTLNSAKKILAEERKKSNLIAPSNIQNLAKHTINANADADTLIHTLNNNSNNNSHDASQPYSAAELNQSTKPEISTLETPAIEASAMQCSQNSPDDLRDTHKKDCEFLFSDQNKPLLPRPIIQNLAMPSLQKISNETSDDINTTYTPSNPYKSSSTHDEALMKKLLIIQKQLQALRDLL